MDSRVLQRAVDALRRLGEDPGEVLGAGVEGAVLALGPDRVAKIWTGRSADEVERLQEFTASLDAASVRLATPRILAVIDDDGLLLTIERRLQGRPLRVEGADPTPVRDDETAVLLDVLEALAGAAVLPGLSALPVLPGERPFGLGRTFPANLADLVAHRVERSRDLLRRHVPDIDELTARTVAGLGSLGQRRVALVHGDLIPANVLVTGARASAVLDFGFLTTLGDPAFDAAVTASVFDMYGPHARLSESLLDDAIQERFGVEAQARGLYRAAYALATATCFSSSGSDGHFAWCLRMLARDDVRDALEP
ncbi:aminoglycoside phosphotransferase [Beutenbergia cavernae DSM 12333]|uniref:Aminoglycoside phosphotransferase n=1 Tax=Beutenbergia cavernae (strain ATCC BAA-8 / DSM 12333 / CCUG 43141 / JCM 11478 / NBRC 16432 / NCIMB 13614 / HKI 0122) TaxID=471853 RepID=C5BZZ9_BEUC1|nr:phosphotransferase [Beutenbergia cavernae]ACQ81329.1 aminoglycoside phosphotransferase [Beutenbergia cavernae DSM 12333]